MDKQINMNVSDLMIGDWIMAEDGVIGHASRMPVQLTGVADKMIISVPLKPGVITSAWPGVKLPLENPKKKMFSPIEITPEILEKNGWVHFGENNGYMAWNSIEHWCYGNRNHCAVIVWKSHDDGKWFIKHHSEDGLTNISMPLKSGSIHELQHALKMAQIEAEITL